MASTSPGSGASLPRSPQIPHMPGSQGYAVASCHVERPLDDGVWQRYRALLERRPGGFAVASLMRPPAAGEDSSLFVARAREAAALGPLGHHIHWTSPTHARPTSGDPAGAVRREGAWLREQGLEPRFFCGGGWYTDAAVEEAVRELGLVDCTPRSGVPAPGVLPTTHSTGALARAVLGPRLPAYVHAYFHDYELGPARGGVLGTSLAVLSRRRPKVSPLSLAC
jgi:hypothetical protein